MDSVEVKMNPRVILAQGQLPELADTVERILRDANVGFFQRAGSLVRVIDAQPEDRRIHRPPGSRVLRPASAAMLQDIAMRVARFEVITNSDGDTRPVDCPLKIANTILSRAGERRFLELLGIIHAPIVRPDGSILATPGYDEATGLLLDSSVDWQVPTDFSYGAVQSAVETLLMPLRDFPFSPEAKAVAISAILTGLQRRTLYSAPAHAFDAPTQGSGKSLWTDCVSIVVTGHEAITTSANADGDELRKKLVSLLLAGDPICALDNITRPLASDALASILTQPVYQDRILGESQMTRGLPTNLLFLLTGNNLVFRADMPSRVIVARLQPECERPELRDGFMIKDLRAWMRSNRKQVVCAALILIAGYFAAGRPDQGLPNFGRFEAWSAQIRSALVWAGLPDPVATRALVDSTNPERDSTLAVFSEWHRATAGQPVTVKELLDKAANDSDLTDALAEAAPDHRHAGTATVRSVGFWCRARRDRIVDNYKLTYAGKARANLARWQVTQTSESL